MTEQAFVIPSSAIPSADSCIGWSIWTFTDLDWHLLRGLPAHTWLRRYRFADDVNEAASLLAECDAEWAMGAMVGDGGKEGQ